MPCPAFRSPLTRFSPMPSRPRSRLLACAIAALVFACASAQAARPTPERRPAARADQPTPARHVPRRVLRKPTLGKRAATIALKAVGVPYRWGGSSPARRVRLLRARLLGVREARGRAPAQLLCALRPGPACWAVAIAGRRPALLLRARPCRPVHRARAHGARRPPAGTSRSSSSPARTTGAAWSAPGASFRARVVACREKGTTMATTAASPTLSDEEVAQLLELTKGADSVELKLTVPVSHRSRGAAALGSGSARQSDSTGLLLRHAGPGAEQEGDWSSALAASRRRVTTRS